MDSSRVAGRLSELSRDAERRAVMLAIPAFDAPFGVPLR